MGSHGYDQHGSSTGGYTQQVRHTVEGSHGGGHKEMYVKEEKKEKKDGKGGMLAAGAGGLAVGAVGGAMIAHAAGMLPSSPRIFSSSPPPVDTGRPWSSLLLPPDR